MASTAKPLEVRYETPEAFRRDYETNLANGGVFVPTRGTFELRDTVSVRLTADFAPGTEVELEAEVVHRVPREMAEVGGTPGVAVQFRESAVTVRDHLAPLLGAAGPTPAASASSDARLAPRKPARLTARIDGHEGMVAGQTRDLSRSGVLVGVEQGSVSVGDPVRVALRHPTSGEELEVEGHVVREVESGGGRVSAVAVKFSPPPEQRETLERFVDDVHGAEHARRLGGIQGAIAELGPQSLVQMLANTAPVGTLVLRNGPDEGTICFQNGLLLLARLGTVTGTKALVRLLSWDRGSFEFHARVEEQERSDAPLPLEAAIFDAVRQIDEGEVAEPSRFPLEACLVAPGGRGEEPSLSKVEAAVLDLARAGFTVHRTLDVIPEPDPEIYRALRSLFDHGLIELR